jgi:hypothetical protein
VDLSPGLDVSLSLSHQSHRKTGFWNPLATAAAEQWGTSKLLQRFFWKGHVASEGFANSQWIDGQLMMENIF